MLIFKNKYVVNDPFNIIFLCGSKFNSTNLRDKRVVLKKYLNKTFGSRCQVIILEENFILKKTNMQYLGYDDIFLNDLSQVEQLASLFANRIIVIHETISTAAEIGMFATLPSLLPKMCILYPDKMSIEENKISGFITLAFNNMNSKSRIGKRIVYYPDIEVFRKSSDKSDYHTYFHNDLIGENLGIEIVSFVKKENNSVNIEYQKMPFGKPIKDKGIVSYRINDNKIETYVDIDVLKMQLLSLFSSKANRKQFRIAKELREHVAYLVHNLEDVMRDTICVIEGIDSSGIDIKIRLKNTEACDIRQAVGYFLYMLQAAEYIILEQTENKNVTVRKIRIKEELDLAINSIKGLVYENKETAFGGIGI